MAVSASAWPTFSLLPMTARSVHKHKLVIQGDASSTLWLLPTKRTILTVIIQSELAPPSTSQDACIPDMNSSPIWVLYAGSLRKSQRCYFFHMQQTRGSYTAAECRHCTEYRNVPELSSFLTPGLPHKWACICVRNKNVIKISSTLNSCWNPQEYCCHWAKRKIL